MTLTRHLFVRLMKKGRLIGLLLLSVVPGATLAFSDFGDTRVGDQYAQVIGTGGFTFAIAALVLTAATLREERDDGTLPYIYMRPLSRQRIALMSLAAGAGAAGMLGIVAWLSSVIGMLAIGGSVSDAVPGLALFLSASVGYAAIFVPVGYLLKRSLLVGLAYLFVIETIVANVISGMAQLSVWKISNSIYLGLESNVTESVVDDLLGPVAAGAGGGMAKLAVVAALGYAVLTWALRTRDAL